MHFGQHATTNKQGNQFTMEIEKVSSSMTKSEPSDSNSSNSLPQKPNTTRPKKPIGGSSKFKGVVCQQNGHWGAQIYANHHRIWLGTFKTEAAAAAAYDSAAIKVRHGNSGEAHRNFPWTALTMYEPNFQAHYTTDQVLNMIKDGSYQTKFGEFLSSISKMKNTQLSNHGDNQNKQEGYFCQELFRKELTPSDVGKLNRLVIPKRYALKYFPIKDHVGRKFGVSEVENVDYQGGDMELKLYDKKMRTWKFRYCYWKSSQSFVFTRGWNKFVRVKELEAKDIVVFYLCELREKDDENMKKFWMIDSVKCGSRDNKVREGFVSGSDEVEEEKVDGETSEIKKAKGFRLFGVHIMPLNNDGEDD